MKIVMSKKFHSKIHFFNDFRGFYCQNSEKHFHFNCEKNENSPKVFEIKMVMKNSTVFEIKIKDEGKVFQILFEILSSFSCPSVFLIVI